MVETNLLASIAVPIDQCAGSARRPTENGSPAKVGVVLTSGATFVGIIS
jgi:hypothetical protein